MIINSIEIPVVSIDKFKYFFQFSHLYNIISPRKYNLLYIKLTPLLW